MHMGEGAMGEARKMDKGHSGMSMGGHMMKPSYSWKDPKMTYSSIPETMGMQMGQVHTLNIPALGYEMDGDIKVYRLTAQPVKRVLTEGKLMDFEPTKKFKLPGWEMKHRFKKEAKLWGYNGEVPGPTIECVQGDRIRIIFKNELPEPSSIHWHGIELPNDMDGAAGETELPTEPGKTRVYEFTVHQVGTYMYHTGYNMMKQDAMGLGGFLVIHPREGYKEKIDKDVAIMINAFALHTGNDAQDLVSMDFNWFTFNGKVAPDIEMITVKKGERVRIRFGNLSMDSHPIHLHGYTWRVVGTEGGPIQESAQWPGNTINIPPGTTRDVEFVAWNPGVWRMHCHKLHHTMNSHADVPLGVMPMGGMFTLLHVVDGEIEEGGER